MLLLVFTVTYARTWTITDSGIAFAPSTLTIEYGDDVVFNLDGSHNSVEVSQSTYNSNGSTPLNGGWATSFGGGAVPSSKLTVGTHYYVCEPHAPGGMKGIIIVMAPTSIGKHGADLGIDLFPNPTNGPFTIRAEQSAIGSGYILTDLTGKQVAQGKIENERTTVDISQLPKGLYFLTINAVRNRSIKLTKK